MKWSLDGVKKLQQKKYRMESGYFIAEGEHLLQELSKAALQQPALRAAQVFLTQADEQVAGQFSTQLISAAQMAKISDTPSPQGVLAVLPMAALLDGKRDQPARHVFYFHEIQDPGNLGSILRTLAWFGDCRCLLSPGSVDPFNPKVVRASMGAIFHVPLETDVALASLPQRFSRIACLDMAGTPVSDAAFQNFDVYVFGNEARGVPREPLQALAAEAFTIAGSGSIESLNLAVSVALCAYELRR